MLVELLLGAAGDAAEAEGRAAAEHAKKEAEKAARVAARWAARAAGHTSNSASFKEVGKRERKAHRAADKAKVSIFHGSLASFDTPKGGGGSMASAANHSYGTAASGADQGALADGFVKAEALDARQQALLAFANVGDDEGLPVLHEACRRGNARAATLLLEAGARPEQRAAGGARRLPAEEALEAGHKHVAQLVHEHAGASGRLDWGSGFLRTLYDNDPPPQAKKWGFLD